MKKRNGLIYLAFLVCTLSACTQNEDLDPGKSIAPEYKTTPVRFDFSTSEMNVLGAVQADTRADNTIVRAGSKKKNTKKEEVKTEDASSMDVTIGAPEEAKTRATSTATTTEKKITNLNIFQFNDAGKLVYASYMAGDGSAVDIDLAQTGTSNTVYVVANAGQDLSSAYKVGASDGTTVADFLKSSFSKTAVDGDLPMIGNKTINMATETSLSVTLNFMVAKVVFTPSVSMDATTLGKFAITSVKLKNVPEKVSMGAITTTAADMAVREITGSTSAPTTWYVPENPAGTKTGITNTDRGDYNAPKTTAMYAEVTGNFTPASATETSPATYQIYLGNGAATDFNVARNTVYNVAATIKGINVQDGRVVIGTDLSEGGTKTANCYIALAKNTYYRFDATKEGNGKNVLLTDANVLGAASATGVSATNITATAIAPTSAFLVWQTAATESGTGNVVASVGLSKRNYVVFRTGSDAEGNALIGVKDAATTAAGTVRWSWHIWKTASDPRSSVDEFKVRNNTTGLFDSSGDWTKRTEKSMKRNLGAANNTVKDKLAGGLLYQWGRKDPFVGSADYATGSTTPLATVVPNPDYAWRDGSAHGAATTAIDPNTSLGGLTAEEYAKKHPTHFIIQYNSTTYDWYAAARTDQNDNLWGNPNADPAPSASQLANKRRGLKTKYDPCPAGWRVAPQDTWTSFTKNSGTVTAGKYANVGGNNFGTGAWQSWNVKVADNSTLVKTQDTFNADKGWTFYYDSDGTGTNTVYFPASGYRDVVSGVLSALGEGGYSWSSSSIGAGKPKAGFLGFRISNYFDPLREDSRPYALPVRCVQE